MVQVNGNSWLSALQGTDSESQTTKTQNPKKTRNCIFIQEGENFVRKDGNGLIFENYSMNKDGTIASHKLYEYNEKGQVVKETEDYEGGRSDGKVDKIITKEYNEKGQVVKETIDWCGGGQDGSFPDGNVDRIITKEYDEKGQLVKETVGDEGGRSDGKAFIRYHIYDAKGNYTHLAVDKNGDGTIDMIQADPVCGKEIGF